MKKPIWESELDRVLQDLYLHPISSALEEDPRCQIDIQGERILQNLCRHYLNEEAVEASALTIRFQEALRCLNPYQLMELDAALDRYFDTLGRRNDQAARQGIACMANAAILVIDMFPNARQPALRKRLKDDRNLIVTSLETFGVEDAGLWCSNRLGTNYNFRKTCSARSKSGKFLKGICIDPAIQMVEAYADENALGLGICGCSEMAFNGGLCDINLPPCMEGLTKSTPFGKSFSKSPSSGGKSLVGSSGGAGLAESGEGSSVGSVEGIAAGTSIDFGPGFGSGAGNMTEFLGQFSEQELMTMGCNQQGTQDFADSIGGLSPAGGCNFREMAAALGQALEGPMEREMRCIREGIQQQRQEELFSGINQEDVYMDPTCALIEGDGEGDGQPEQPTQEACSGANPPSNCRNTDACTGSENPSRCRTARNLGTNRLRNNSTTRVAIQRQCNRVRGANCSPEEIEEALRTGVHAAQSRSFSNPRGSVEGGKAVAAYDPNSDMIEMGQMGVLQPNTWAHEAYHAATDALGVNLVKVSGCSRGDIDCFVGTCYGSPCRVRNIDHDTLAEVNSPYRDPGPDGPVGPDFGGRCSGNDLANNVLYQCTIGAQQEREAQEEMERRDPLGPRIYPADPEPEPEPRTVAAAQIMQACDRSAGGNMMDAVNQYCQQVAGGDTPDDPPDVCLQNPVLCNCELGTLGGELVRTEECDPAREACPEDPLGDLRGEGCEPGTTWRCSFGQGGIVCGCQEGGGGILPSGPGGDPEGGLPEGWPTD